MLRPRPDKGENAVSGHWKPDSGSVSPQYTGISSFVVDPFRVLYSIG